MNTPPSSTTRRFPAARAVLFLVVAAAWLAACGKGTPGPAETPADSGEARRARVFLTSRAGDAMRETGAISLVVPTAGPAEATAAINVYPDRERQVFHGVGGSLTQASAAALGKLSPEKRAEVLAAYFGPDGAGYALSRTHVGSSDFSEYSYDYAPDDDPSLAGFSIEEDRQNGLLELITDAQAVPGASFRIVASPWTAPPWMKDNGKYYGQGRGGRLLEATTTPSRATSSPTSRRTERPAWISGHSPRSTSPWAMAVTGRAWRCPRRSSATSSACSDPV